MTNINSQKGGALVWIIIILVVVIGGWMIFGGRDAAMPETTEMPSEDMAPEVMTDTPSGAATVVDTVTH